MAGRPSSYDPAFCDVAVEFLEQGYSTTALAGYLSVARSTVYKWAEEHEAFSDALKVGQAKSALWWEGKARLNAETGEGQASTIIFGLKNRVAEDWREKAEHDHKSSDGTMTPRGDGAAKLAAAVDAFAARLAAKD